MQRVSDPEYCKSISDALKGRPGRAQTENTKQKLRELALQRYAEGWESRAGRCKKIKYNSPVAGEVSLDGSWELAVAQYLDTQHLTWKRNKTRFPYTHPKGYSATYCPDFYIEEWKSYLEIKGYETPLDRVKWSQFKCPLIVWKRQQLREHGIEFLTNGTAKTN